MDVAEALLEAGVSVDEVNETGDTALHKASFIGNEVSYQINCWVIFLPGKSICVMNIVHRCLLCVWVL